MAKVTACAAPESSLLAEFGGPEDYTDCFYRDVPGEVSLPEFIERFYCSTAFLPEQLILKVLRTPVSSADVRALASGEADRFGAWKVVGPRGAEVLLESKDTNTASWFCVEPRDRRTCLYFGSWVGGIDQSGWRSMLGVHVWYSKLLLGGV